ncbi:MAG: cytochrome c [Gemmatimonadota bacterium]
MKLAFKLVGALLLLVVLIAAGAIGLGTTRFQASIGAPSHTPATSADSAGVAEGRRLVQAYACRECHGSDLAGTDFIVGMPFMDLPAPNLTGGTFTPEQLERAIRHGIGADGRPLVVMPSRAFAHLSDEEIDAITSYLVSVPRQERTLIERSIGPIGRVVAATAADKLFEYRGIDQEVAHPASPPSAEFGAYLVQLCAFCHGPDLGGKVVETGPAPHWAPNLTPDPATGLGQWSLDQFRTAFQGGTRPDGRSLDSQLMPWTAFGAFNERESEAMWNYLRSLAPVERPVPSEF